MVMYFIRGNALKFTQYSNEGKILFSGDIPASMIEDQEGNICLGEESPFTHYVLDGVFTERPVSPVRLGADSVLRDIPVGAVIWIKDTAYPTVDSFCGLEFAYSGEYQIKVEAFPFLDFTTSIKVA